VKHASQKGPQATTGWWDGHDVKAWLGCDNMHLQQQFGGGPTDGVPIVSAGQVQLYA
jgi:hypothetical protein